MMPTKKTFLRRHVRLALLSLFLAVISVYHSPIKTVMAGIVAGDPCSTGGVSCYNIQASVDGQVVSNVATGPTAGQSVSVNTCTTFEIGGTQCASNTYSVGTAPDSSSIGSNMVPASIPGVVTSQSNTISVSGSSDPDYVVNSVDRFCPGQSGTNYPASASGSVNLPDFGNGLSGECKLIVNYVKKVSSYSSPQTGACSGTVSYNACNSGTCSVATLDRASYFSNPANPPFDPNNPSTCPNPSNQCQVNADCVTGINITAIPIDQQMTIGTDPYKTYVMTASKTGPGDTWGFEIQCPFNTECQAYDTAGNQIVNWQSDCHYVSDGNGGYDLTCTPQSMAYNSWKTGYFQFENSSPTKTIQLRVRSSTVGNYTLNLRGYVISNPQVACVGECNKSTTASFRAVAPSCDTLITTPPAKVGTCSNVSATGYTITWTSAGPSGSFSDQAVRVSSAYNGAALGECAVSGNGTYDPTNCKNLGNTTATTFNATNLQPNTLYYNRVAALCTNPDSSIGYKDTGTWTCQTNTASSCVANPNPTSFNGTAVPVSSVYLTTSTGNLTVGWNSVSGATSYTVTLYNANSGLVFMSSKTVSGSGALTTSFSVTPGSSGTRYGILITSNVTSPAVACTGSTVSYINVFPPATSCPSVSPAPAVNLNKTTATNGDTTIKAQAPAGFTCTGFGSSNTGVATVDSAGNVTTVAPGSTNISASGCVYQGGPSCSVNPTTLTIQSGAPSYDFTLSPTTFNFSAKLAANGTLIQPACKDMNVTASSGNSGSLAVGLISDHGGGSYPLFTYDNKINSTGDYNLTPGATYFGSGNICIQDNPVVRKVGTYNESVAYAGYVGGVKQTVDKPITVSLTVTAAKYSYTTSGSPSFSAVQNAGTLPPSQSIVINNNGDQSLTITPSEAISWATMNVTSPFTLAPGASQTINVSVNRTDLTPSVYTGSINFTEPNAGNKAVAVQYTVTSGTSCVNPGSRPAPVMTAPASAPVNSTFEITCNYGSNLDYIPAPSGCSWPGSNGGWIGSAATFSCTAPSTPQNKTYTCQSQNGGPAGSTVWCSLPNPVSKTVTVTGTAPSVSLTANPAVGPSPLTTILSWTVGNDATSCVGSSNPSVAAWDGNKSYVNGTYNQQITGLTDQTTFTLTCSNSAGNTSSPVLVTPTAPSEYTITVDKTQCGSVISNDGGISCGATCQGSYTDGSTVTLTPYPATQCKFTGWTGACTGMGGVGNTCALDVNGSDMSVTAHFTLKPFIFQEF